jgi:iron complex outermembrane recepter protein
MLSHVKGEDPHNDESDSAMRSNSTGTRFPRFLSSIALGLSMMMHAVADENVAPGSSAKFEEIIVEARKRAESLQDVPVSVATISPVKLQNNDATDLAKLGEIVPQVTIGQFMGGTGAVMTIRGISSSPINAGLDQSVSFVTDGVQLSRGHIIQEPLFDVRQVDVLEGPQALFFGKNSPAGVISLQTADPTNSFEAYAKTGYEFIAAEKYVEGAVSGPLSDYLTARFAFRGDWIGGWLKNVAQPVKDPVNPSVTDPGALQGEWGPSGHNYSGRLTLLWKPLEDFEVKLKVSAAQQDVNGGDAYSEQYCVGNTTVPVVLGGLRVPGGDCAKNMVQDSGSDAATYAMNFPYGNGGVPYLTSKFILSSLTLDEHVGPISLTSVTGYYSQTLSDSFGGDYTSFVLIYAAEHEHYELVTQEVRVNTALSGPINAMAGLYFEHSARPWDNALDLFHAGINPAIDSYMTSDESDSNTSDTYSGFAQLRWNIVPTIEFAVGARYTHDVKESSLENLANNPYAPSAGFLLYPQDKMISVSTNDNNVSPEVTLSWHPEPSETLYAAYKTGYKAGSIANPPILAATTTAQNQQVKPETTRGFEVGFKADLLNDKVRLEITGYRYDYYDLQVASVYIPTQTVSITNAATALTEGLQGSLRWLVNAALSFEGAFSFNRARYQVFPTAQCYAGQTAANGCVNGVQNLSGQALPRAPDVAFNLGAAYSTKVMRGWFADLSIKGSYSSSYQTTEDNAPGGLQPAYWLFDAAVHLKSDDGHLDFAVIGRDLTNTYYMVTSVGVAGSGNNNQYVGSFNRPREVILEAAYHF